MTIEQKAKAYDKAIEKIKYVMEHGISQTLNKEDLEDIFPELKESEDERISREITEFILTHRIDEPNDIEDTNHWLTWLEKQGQVKESDISQHENKICKENDDSLTCEDEKMKKAIISYIDYEGQRGGEWFGVKVNDIIAWLEKQKYSDFDMENEYWRGYDDAKKHMEEKQLTEQKPVKWSDEDDGMVACIKAHLRQSLTSEAYTNYRLWLESLKQRMEEL